MLGPAVRIKRERVKKAINNKMKSGSWAIKFVVEMLKGVVPALWVFLHL